MTGFLARKAYLKPKSTPNLTLVAYKSRGPLRVFGFTKSQILDTMMRSNATICVTISLTSIPLAAIMIYRYQTILKPRKLEYEKKKQEELLAEGAFEKL